MHSEKTEILVETYQEMEKDYLAFWKSVPEIFELMAHHDSLVKKSPLAGTWEDYGQTAFFWVSLIASGTFASMGKGVWEFFTIPLALALSLYNFKRFEKKNERLQQQARRDQSASYVIIKKGLYKPEVLAKILPYLRERAQAPITDNTVFTLLSCREVFNEFVFSLTEKNLSDEGLERFLCMNSAILDDISCHEEKKEKMAKKRQLDEKRDQTIKQVLGSASVSIFKKEEDKNQRYLQML